MIDRHQRFAELHERGTFVIPNAGDAATAAVIEAAGAVAIATSSGAHASSLGRIDALGEVTREECVERTAQIAGATTLPVSVDAEEGYGSTPDAVAETIRLLADAGASGASIEDWTGDPERGFFGIDEAVERVQAACEAAASLGRPFVITARSEAFLHPNEMAAHASGGQPMLEAVIERLRRFGDAGAHCLYAPGDGSDDTLRRIVDETGSAINALVPVGSARTTAQLAALGVRRISVGASLYRVGLGHIRDVVAGLVADGQFEIGATAIGSGELDRLLRPESS